MTDHSEYMPKPEGWVPPVPQPEEPVAETADEPQATEAHSESIEEKTSVDDGKLNQPEDNTPLERAITLASNLLSWILVPLMMPVYGIILIFSLSILSLSPSGTKLTFTLIVFGVNFLLPMIMVLVLKKLGIIQDVGLNGRKERLIPYIISIICLGGTALFLNAKGAPLWVAMFYAGGAAAALINLVVNFWWKISAHAAGIAGIVAMLIQMMKEGVPSGSLTWWIIGSILLAGMLGSARVWLGRHTLLQVLAGSAVGFICVWSLSLISV